MKRVLIPGQKEKWEPIRSSAGTVPEPRAQGARPRCGERSRDHGKPAAAASSSSYLSKTVSPDQPRPCRNTGTYTVNNYDPRHSFSAHCRLALVLSKPHEHNSRSVGLHNLSRTARFVGPREKTGVHRIQWPHTCANQAPPQEKDQASQVSGSQTGREFLGGQGCAG